MQLASFSASEIKISDSIIASEKNFRTQILLALKILFLIFTHERNFRAVILLAGKFASCLFFTRNDLGFFCTRKKIRTNLFTHEKTP